MKIRFTQIFLVIYLIAASFIVGKIQLMPFAIFVLIFVLNGVYLKNKLNPSIENLLYIIIAFFPFPYLLAIFLIHLPFIVFGLMSSNRSFIKSYITGFSISLIPTVILYTASNYFDFPLNFFTIALIFYLPVIAALIIAVRKGKVLHLIEFDSRECIIMLAILLLSVFVGINIVRQDTLFISNGTYLYTKFELIAKSIKSQHSFPIYDPATSQGESPFLFESPLVFSHLAFVNTLLAFIPKVTFYTAFSLFILFLATLSLSLLIRAVLNMSFKENWDSNLHSIITVIVGSATIGLNFYFVQLLESFKQFFAFPINYLIFSLLLEKPKHKEVMLVLYMIILTFVIHTPHGVGIVLISLSLFFLILLQLYFSKELSPILQWIVSNKLKVISSALILILFPSFYVTPPFLFEDFLEENPKTNWENSVSASFGYIKAFLTSNSPLSLRYPDITRNDDKKFGTFITVFGILSLAVLIIFWAKTNVNFKLFSSAYFMHILISAVIINFPTIGSLEYSYRTAEPYLLILLVLSICAFISLVGNKYAKLALIIIFTAGLLHMLPLAKKNIENVHKEGFISGTYYADEISLVKNLPQDGRIITYGMYANAIDPGMASLTNRYFSRFHLTQYARSRSIYWKIHSPHSFGHTNELLAMSGTELSNYLRLGGYKYVFTNICHPIGSFVVQKIYLNFSYPIYQKQCNAFLVVNNTNYAEKVSILKNFDESKYKEKDGYKFLKLSPYHNFVNVHYSEKAIEPIKLDFKRVSPTKIEVYGNFEDKDWLTFKETYFPRWKAFMDSKQIPVYASNHDLILVNTAKGNVVKLKYEILPVEKIFGALSLISILALLIVFIAFV